MKDIAIKIRAINTPWEVACMLINTKIECEDIFGTAQECPMFTNKELQKIGEHLVNYAKVEEDGE